METVLFVYELSRNVILKYFKLKQSFRVEMYDKVVIDRFRKKLLEDWLVNPLLHYFCEATGNQNISGRSLFELHDWTSYVYWINKHIYSETDSVILSSKNKLVYAYSPFYMELYLDGRLEDHIKKETKKFQGEFIDDSLFKHDKRIRSRYLSLQNSRYWEELKAIWCDMNWEMR